MLASVDWNTVSSLATGVGTLVLAVATFASVRSANHAARTAERAFELGKRPLLFPSRLEDSDQKIRWGDDHWAHVPGGSATFEEVDGMLYMAISLRNVGAGIAVIHSWRARDIPGEGVPRTVPPIDEFRPQTRDMYLPAGEISFWQAAIRDHDDHFGDQLRQARVSRQAIYVDLMYSDHEGEQRSISRFILSPRSEEGDDWLVGVVRHWNLDRPDPRQ